MTKKTFLLFHCRFPFQLFLETYIMMEGKNYMFDIEKVLKKQKIDMINFSLDGKKKFAEEKSK